MELRDILNEGHRDAKSKFEVRYTGSKGKKVEVAKFMTLSASKKFLKDIKKTGAKGVIFVNGRPLKLTKQMTMDFGESRKGAKK